MKGLREKLLRHEGFTLVEMLIVVAIIAILVAVSIPMVSSTLEKARHAIDEANMRDAISLASVQYLSGEIDFKAAGEDGVRYYHVDDASHKGTLTKTHSEAVKSECTGKGLTECTGGNKDKVLKVEITEDGDATASWVAAATP